jgi:E3 ubiquitin-protein ligase synoviolin
MTIFREEVGAWFLLMFVGLMAGKVWGWIGAGRLEVFEQQPPANPRLFHIRLFISFTMLLVYDLTMVTYCLNSVMRSPKPDMMVMFLFEFAILLTSSLSTVFRYIILLAESNIVKKQTLQLLAARRAEITHRRQEIIRQREARGASGEDTNDAANDEPLPDPNEIEEMDIEPPGWEAKGQWIFTLDLVTCMPYLHLVLL